MSNKANEQLEKIVEKLQSMDQRNWYFIFGGLLLLLFVFDYALLMKPQLKTLTKLNPEIKVLSDNLKNAKTDIERITQYKDQVIALKEEVDLLRSKVRTKQEVAFIIEKISRLAHTQDVKIDQIMPNPLQQEIMMENAERTYYDLPIIIEARSTYHNFGRFINELESEETFFKVEDFSLASIAGSRLNAVKVTLKTIVYEEN